MGKHSTALALFCGFVFALGCAQGTDTTTGDDAITNPDAEDNPQHIDANPLPIDAHLIDANIPIDSSLPIDASTSLLPDGSTCTSSAQCMSACCVLGFDACLPDPGIPGDCQ